MNPRRGNVYYFEGNITSVVENTTNPYLEVGTLDGTHEWNYSGIFNGTNTTLNLASAINSNLSGCSADNLGYCLVSLLFHLDSGGLLEISNINITYQGNRSCEFCVASDGVCDTEWTIGNVTTTYNSSSLGGNCSFPWNTSNYNDANYNISFRIKDIAGNNATASSKTTVLDRTAPVFYPNLLSGYNLLSPVNNGAININRSTNNTKSVTFVYFVNDLSLIANCSLILNGVINQTSTSINRSRGDYSLQNGYYTADENKLYLPLSTNISLSSIQYFNWSINCTDVFGHQSITGTRRFTLIITGNYTGETTDLTQVNISNIENLTFENVTSGKIRFSENIDLSTTPDVASHITIAHNLIKINSSAIPALNKSAILYLYNLTFGNPRILKDGSLCPSDICTKESYANDLLTFIVTQFSTYSAEETPPSSGGCGSCGGSGGGGSSSAKETATISAKAGEEKTVSFSKDFGVTEIAVTLTKRLFSEPITVEEVKAANSAVVSAGSTGSNVYKYLKITSKAALEKAKIKFKVSLGWFAQQDYDENSVVLKHYTDKWESLPTEKISRDSKYAYYEAETSSLSLFAITAEKKAVEMIKEKVAEEGAGNATEKAENVTGEIAGNVTERKEEIVPGKEVKWYLFLIVVIIIAGLGYLVYYGMRKK